MKIRGYTPSSSEDSAIATLHARVHPDAPHPDGSEFKERIQQIKTSTFHRFWMVEEKRLIAYMVLSTPWWDENDDVMMLFLDVDPEYRQRGLATTLVDIAWQELQKYPYSEISTKIHNDDQHSIQFAQRQRLQPVMQFLISECDLTKTLPRYLPNILDTIHHSPNILSQSD